MASNFEKVMNACLESKKAAAKKSLNSNKRYSKRISENKKFRNRSLRENDDLIDDDIYNDEDLDDLVDDVADDIMVVVDPDMEDSGDISDTAACAQEIIDSTPDGEIPSTDEYIGDKTYTCPICGNTFFSEVEMTDGDECPVCGETPNGFVYAGSVESTDEEFSDNEEEEEEEELVASDPIEDESFKRSSAIKRKKRTESKLYSNYSLDETTFNPFLNKFIRENYKNSRMFTVTNASLRGHKLRLECKLTFKSGKSKRVMLTVENFKPARKMTLVTREDGTFKCESKNAKVAPFIFEAVMINNVIKCTGMKYNFITSIKEGKRAQVSGKLIKESKNYSNRKRR